ncbi:TrfB-related DNA-binding protein [Zophobihabitans entericus]|uniref:Transcriptional regulator n=1 Tax=Zophobihabitans entericus TaxID=1635327 RepID=A0A6G9IFE8_9GAMM|nr:TrfB-related DNA-binding protein [Zophobihabitans entericus]QIQ22539.1 transcriptional regulator [Zophobihabitans entericus]
MKKKLTEEQFNLAVKKARINEQTKMIAYEVLVKGTAQTHFVKLLGLSKGAISQAVSRVFNAYHDNVPAGYEKVTVILPKHKAFIVKQWDKTKKNT